MKLNFYSHACVRIEDAGKSIICDPWLVGDTFWGSWRLTPNSCIKPEELECDFIAISHWHFDHMNYQTLKRIDKNLPVLIPKFPITWMRQTLKKIGFQNVIEIDHAKPFSIGNGVSIVMYQCQYQDDCVIVFHGPSGDVINLNDSKPLKSLMKAIKHSCSNILVTLRSYSYAWSYPSRFNLKPDDLILINDDFYIKKFYFDSIFFRPKIIVGFASGISHPIEGFESENSHLVSFESLKNYIHDNFPLNDFPLLSGKSGAKLSFDNGLWDYVEDFLCPLPYESTSNCISITNYKGSIDFSKRIFNRFFKSTRYVHYLIPFNYCIGFFDFNKNFLFGFDSCKGYLDHLDSAPDVEYYIDEYVLHDSLKKNIFTNIDISKLWSVKINSELSKHFIFTVIFALYEHGYFRMNNIFNKRFFTQWFYRRSEIFDYLKMILKSLLLRKKLAEIFSEIS